MADRARIDAAADAIARRWYAYGDSGPTEHGWMRELATAAVEALDDLEGARRLGDPK